MTKEKEQEIRERATKEAEERADEYGYTGAEREGYILGYVDAQVYFAKMTEDELDA